MVGGARPSSVAMCHSLVGRVLLVLPYFTLGLLYGWPVCSGDIDGMIVPLPLSLFSVTDRTRNFQNEE